MLSLEEAVRGQWRQFYPEHLSGIMPYGEDDFTYVEDYENIKKINKKSGEDEVILTLSQINEAIKKSGKEELKHFPFWDYAWQTENIITFKSGTNFYVYNKVNKSFDFLADLPEKAEHIRFCKENKKIAFTIDNNLFFMDEKLVKTAITNDENAGIVNGSSYVHRQEFGIDNGIFWSPKGNFMAFYRKDETMVDDYPLVNTGTRIASLKNSKYPMIGEKSEEVTLGIYKLKTKKTVFVDVKDFTAERYLTCITWDPDEKYIYIAVLNREQNKLKLNKYDAETGKFVKTLFVEEHEKYVEPEHQLIFVKNQNDKFLWYSERDGYNHLYMYDTEGKLISQLTKGKWIVLDFLQFDEKGKNFFITSTKESPIELHTYKVNLETSKIEKITSNAGIHKTVISNSSKYFIDTYNNTEIPNATELKNKKGKTIKSILKAKNPLLDYKIGDMKIGKIKAADGKTDLYYRLITPPDYDPNKKYPAIVYVYGGPHAQMIQKSWKNGGLWKYYMAQKGYVVFTIDNRGSSNRGLEFENVIHRQCGQEEVADQMKGIEFLTKLSYVDKNRIGVHGWSYGGFMTTSLMTMHPDIFKVGVAGGPVIDWKYYEVMYGERYMDTPKENPEGFEKTSLLNKAKDIEGRLLIIHGYIDPVVVPQNSLDFIRSCIKAKTDVDFFLYPDSEHNMRGETRVHLMKKVTRYFDDFLK